MVIIAPKHCICGKTIAMDDDHCINSLMHCDIIGHKNSNYDSFFLVLMTNTCCIVCVLIVVCFFAGTVAMWRMYDDGGHHDCTVQ